MRDINIDGPKGNAHYLLGMAREWSRQMEWDYEPIQRQMMSGDYTHLLKVFADRFQAFARLVKEVDGDLVALCVGCESWIPVDDSSDFVALCKECSG